MIGIGLGKWLYQPEALPRMMLKYMFGGLPNEVTKVRRRWFSVVHAITMESIP